MGSKMQLKLKNILGTSIKFQQNLTRLKRNSLVVSTISALPLRHYSTPTYKSKWIKSDPQDPYTISSVVNIEPTSGITIPEFLRINLHKWENAPAFTCAVSGRSYTHGQVHKKGKSFATALKQHGLKQRDAVCVLLPNIPEYPIVCLGIWDAGLIASTINPTYTAEEVAKQVNDCGGKVIIVIPQLLQIIEKVKKMCPSLKSVIVVSIGDEKNNYGHHSFFDMIKTDSSNFKALCGSDIDTIKETAVLPYSSGTTGAPKGVELTHSTFTTNLLQITYPGYLITQFFDKGNSQDRTISVLPFFHMYGLQIIMVHTMYQGGHTMCFPKFEPAMFIKGIKQHKPTVMHLVTPLIAFICQCKEFNAEDFKELRGVIAGAAPIGPSIIEQFVNIFDHYVMFQEGFGMTELSCVSHTIPLEMKNSVAGSTGVLLPGTSSKIFDNDLGKFVGPNHSGEIFVKGPQVMKGYYNNEKATKETIDSDGYLKTGDIGYYDERGFMYIVDRLKDLIKVKGLQVAPAELEDVLRQHPEIADVAIIGVPHDKFGEAPRAYIIPKNKSLTEASVNNFLNAKVSEHKRLVGGIEFTDQIPKALSGKILRRVLRKQFESK